jgi:hypothetical protein
MITVPFIIPAMRANKPPLTPPLAPHRHRGSRSPEKTNPGQDK